LSPLEKCLFDEEEVEREKRMIFFNFGIRRGDIEIPDFTTPSGNFVLVKNANLSKNNYLLMT
jgi:hypothetical protein